MTDPELIALAALVKADALMRDAFNQQRLWHGFSPGYDTEVEWPERDALHAELVRRKVIEP